ncbi:hypothetical protein V8B97DRAFT_2019519 [Scleroderma yunnanense]
MTPGQRRTILVPFNLGPASNYDPTIFPIFKPQGPLEEGDIFLIATMNEMAKIRDMSKHVCDYRQLLENLKQKYDELVDQKEALEMQQVSFNPIKLFSKYRKTKIFLMAVRTLYLKTRNTSEKLKRDLFSLASCPSSQSQGFLEDEHLLGVSEDPGNANQIKGLAIPFEGELDAETRTLIEEAASILNSKELFENAGSSLDTVPGDAGSSSSSSRFSSSSSSTSSPSINVTIVNNLQQSNATVLGCTIGTSSLECAALNVGGSGNTGTSQS